MYIETSSPRRPGDKANLVLTIPNNGEMSCLSFYYHMYGASVGTLNVYSGNSKVFYISGQQSNYWIMVERNIILNGLVRERSVLTRALFQLFIVIHHDHHHDHHHHRHQQIGSVRYIAKHNSFRR